MKPSLRERIRVDFIRNDEQELAAFRALYAQLIDSADQVDPAYILQWYQQPGRAPTSGEELARCVRDRPFQSCYLLLGAWHGDRLVGFANVVYVPATGLVFFAYFAALPVAGAPGAVTVALARYMRFLGERIWPRWQWVALELSLGSDGRAAARRRLFSKYLRALELVPARLPVGYRVPSLYKDGVTVAPQHAELILASRELGSALDRRESLRIVRSIYFGIYADALAPGSEGEAYREGLQAELAVMESALNQERGRDYDGSSGLAQAGALRGAVAHRGPGTVHRPAHH